MQTYRQDTGRGCVVSGCAETGTCPAARAHHPTFSSVTHPPHTPAAISFQALGIKSGCSPNSVSLCAPPSDSGGSLPHPHSLWSGSVCLHSLKCEWITSEHICVSPSHCGPPHRPPPALKRIRSGVREESLLRGPPSSLFPPRPLVPSSPISRFLPPPLPLPLVLAATPTTLVRLCWQRQPFRTDLRKAGTGLCAFSGLQKPTRSWSAA